MRNLFVLLIICLCTSCADREVQLPHTSNNDITEIVDVSPVYIFYDESMPDNVDFNRRNMISTTNWLVNIDKRLTLKQLLPHLQYLYEKRHGDGMHTNENAKNYFTCFNPDTENLAFIEFTNTNYTSDVPSMQMEDKKQYVKITSNGKVEPYNNTGVSYESFTTFLSEIQNQNEIVLVLSGQLSMQAYINLKSAIASNKNMDVIISTTEFIFN